METIDKETLQKVSQIYKNTLSDLDHVLIGQNKVKKVVVSSMLCSKNARILLMGNVGMGKTTLSKFLSSSFSSARISVASDMITSDIQDVLKDRENDLRSLLVDEMNRAGGKVQNAFIELLAENQMNIGSNNYKFEDFYAFATQNNADITGIFNVSQALYDRFDVNAYFEHLTRDELGQVLFNEFVPNEQSHLSESDITFTTNAVKQFQPSEIDINIMMDIFMKMNAVTLDGKRLFPGDNVRAHAFAIKLMKLKAMTEERNNIYPTDILDYIDSLYLHRIDQTVTRMDNDNVKEKFECLKQEIKTMKRPRR